MSHSRCPDDATSLFSLPLSSLASSSDVVTTIFSHSSDVCPAYHRLWLPLQTLFYARVFPAPHSETHIQTFQRRHIDRYTIFVMRPNRRRTVLTLNWFSTPGNMFIILGVLKIGDNMALFIQLGKRSPHTHTHTHFHIHTRNEVFFLCALLANIS